MQIIVIFSPQTHYFWQKFLRRGFAHVFVAIKLRRHFMVIDAMAPHCRFVDMQGLSKHEIISHYQQTGCFCISNDYWHAREKKFALEFFNCVVAVKRILGLSAPMVQTPYQLYQLLIQLGFTDHATDYSTNGSFME